MKVTKTLWINEGQGLIEINGGSSFIIEVAKNILREMKLSITEDSIDYMCISIPAHKLHNTFHTLNQRINERSVSKMKYVNVDGKKTRRERILIGFG